MQKSRSRSPDLLTTALPEVQLPSHHHAMLRRRKQAGGDRKAPQGAQLAKGRAGAGAPKDKQREGEE